MTGSCFRKIRLDWTRKSVGLLFLLPLRKACLDPNAHSHLYQEITQGLQAEYASRDHRDQWQRSVTRLSGACSGILVDRPATRAAGRCHPDAFCASTIKTIALFLSKSKCAATPPTEKIYALPVQILFENSVRDIGPAGSRAINRCLSQLNPCWSERDLSDYYWDFKLPPSVAHTLISNCLFKTHKSGGTSGEFTLWLFCTSSFDGLLRWTWGLDYTMLHHLIPVQQH